MTTLDPTPRWSDIQSRSPAAHEELQRLAARVFETTSEHVTSEGGFSETVAAAITLNLAEVRNAGTAFVDSSVRDDYLARYACCEMGVDWSNPHAFAKALGDIQHVGALLDRDGVETIAKRAIGILVADGIPILSHVAALASLPDEQRQPFWTAYSAVCDSLPDLQLTADDLVDQLVPVLSASANDMTSGMIYDAVGKWAIRSQAQAEALLQSARVKKVHALMPTALWALSQFDRDTAHTTALELLDALDASAKSAGALSLGLLSYRSDADELLAQTLTRLTSAVATGDGAVKAAVGQAYFALLRGGWDVKDSILHLSSETDARVRYMMANGLFHCAKDSVGDAWWRTSLRNLASTQKENGGTYRLLDFAANALATVDAHAALDFVRDVVASNSADGSEIEVHELLAGTMSELHRTAPTILQEAITDWFGSEQRFLHQLAATIVRSHVSGRVRSGTPLVLDETRLGSYSEEQVVCLLQRVAGWVHGGPEVAALIASSLRGAPEDRVVAVASELLKAIVLYNYPGSAGDFLRSRVASSDATDAEKKAISEALSESDAYYDALRRLPEVQELRIPRRRAYLRRLETSRMNERIMEEARKRSVMLSLVTRVPLKYGRAFFSDHGGTLSEPVPLNSYSHEMEMPRGEVVDPIGQLSIRINLRAAVAFDSPRRSGDST
jgi:hypothetical protein